MAQGAASYGEALLHAPAGALHKNTFSTDIWIVKRRGKGQPPLADFLLHDVKGYTVVGIEKRSLFDLPDAVQQLGMRQ